MTTAIEVLHLALFATVAVALLVGLGRMHTASIELSDTAHSAARAASLAGDLDEAVDAADRAVAGGPLSGRCDPRPDVTVHAEPSDTGEWSGGAVTVTVRCRVRVDELVPGWLPGSRLLAASDTQPIDGFRE